MLYHPCLHTAFEKLSAGTMRARVADRLREAILLGSLPLGKKVVERELASRLEVSVTVIREALIQLEAEGFITKRPNAATYVTQLSPEDTQKVFEIRRVLEGYAVEEAARRVTLEQIRALEALYLEMVDAARAGDLRLFMQKDYDWHCAVWESTGNDQLVAALRRIVLPLFAFATIRLGSASEFDLLADAQAHQALLVALRRKQPAASREALEAALRQWSDQTNTWVFGQEQNSQKRP